MKFLYTIIFTIILSLSCNAAHFTTSDVNKALHQLDKELERCNVYKEKRAFHLDSLKEARRNLAKGDSLAWLKLTMDIAQGYNAYNNDSSLIYYTEGYDRTRLMAPSHKGSEFGAQLDSLRILFRARRATYISLAGFIDDAVKEYAAVDTTEMSPSLRAEYYDAGRQMFSYIASYYGNFFETHEYWMNHSIHAQRRLLSLLNPQSEKYKLNLGEYYYNIHEYAKSRQVLIDLMSSLNRETSMYAVATHILASIAHFNGDRNEYLYYLTQSAIADMRHATLEVVSLQELAGELYQAGDEERAHKYISEALNSAVESRASVRMMQTTELLTIVEEDHNAQIAHWHTLMMIINAIFGVLIIALIVSFFFLRKQINRLARLKQELQGANKTKDVYISQFLSLCSVYMDKVKQLCNLANRKIAAGQIEDLYKITKSGKFIEEQNVEFYKVFDDAFLHIYPNFVENVNKLLRPEEQIVMADGEMLNSDLRILAFMRLGIDDTNRIAQILNFSVNTIYAYRNRLRNRAIDRNTFEADIMKIGNLE